MSNERDGANGTGSTGLQRIPDILAPDGPAGEPLESLAEGQRLVFGGDRVAIVPAALADAFEAGDRLVIVQATGALLHIPADVGAIVDTAVGAATDAFKLLARCDDASITAFFDAFAGLVADDTTFSPIAEANALDVAAAVEAGRSTTRLVLSERMRLDMVSGLQTWRDVEPDRDTVVDQIDHDGWTLELRRAPLGVVGFVFEGRPNVFADACGVLRSGNTVVFRIGSDVLGTARAIVQHALRPALLEAGLPLGAVQLVESPERSAGHALFDDRRLALAVARGSGAAVAELGAVASQAGTPVSLHGTGGAWMIAGDRADAAEFAAAVEHSLDRKVCNTLNVCAIPLGRAAELVPVFLDALQASAAGDDRAVLHLTDRTVPFVGEALRDVHDRVNVVDDLLSVDALGIEWEWEGTPEVSLVIVDQVADAVEFANRFSPQFIVSVITTDAEEFERCYGSLNAPFVGDGFTRWVDGQYALDRPELGLANWQNGRLLGRGAILSGDGVHTVRYVARITDPSTHR